MKTLILVLAFFPLYSFAGYEGNGGDGLYCNRGGKTTVVMFDLHEAKVNHNLDFDFGPASLSAKQKVEYALERLNKIDPYTARILTGFHKDFYSQTRFTEQNLIDIPDTGAGGYPDGCEVRQVAIQMEPSLPGDMRFTIDKKLYDLMTADHQAGLILHELVLQMARVKHKPWPRAKVPEYHSDTRRVRYYTGWISSAAISNLSLEEYLKVLEAAKFPHVSARYMGIGIYNWDPTYDGKRDFPRHPNSKAIAYAGVMAGTPFSFQLPSKTTINGVFAEDISHTGLTPSGDILEPTEYEVRTTQPLVLQFGQIKIELPNGGLAGLTVGFGSYENSCYTFGGGKLSSPQFDALKGAVNFKKEFPSVINRIHFKEARIFLEGLREYLQGYKVEFDELGRIRSVYEPFDPERSSYSPFKFRTPHGEIMPYRVAFNPNGTVAGIDLGRQYMTMQNQRLVLEGWVRLHKSGRFFNAKTYGRYTLVNVKGKKQEIPEQSLVCFAENEQVQAVGRDCQKLIEKTFGKN